MDTWKHLVGDRSFISDLGKNQEAEIAGTKTVLGRYAVWVSVPETDRHRIVEVGDDLSALMEKYDVPSELVLKLGSFMPDSVFGRRNGKDIHHFEMNQRGQNIAGADLIILPERLFARTIPFD